MKRTKQKHAHQFRVSVFVVVYLIESKNQNQSIPGHTCME